MKIRSLISMNKLTLSALAALALTAMPAQAADRYWNGVEASPDAGGGNGTWNIALTNWQTAPTGGSSTAWVNGNNDTAFFGNTVGTVSLDTGITVGGVQFDTAGYVVQSNTLTFGVSGNILTNADATINSALAATSLLTITKTGSGTLTLGGNNTYAGATTISAGTLRAGSATGISANSALNVNAGIFDLNGFNATVASLGAGTSSGNITNSAAGSGTNTLTITNFSSSLASLVTDGATAKTALVVANSGGTPNFANANNTFSGGLTLNSSNTRLLQGAVSTTLNGTTIVKSTFGTGAISIGHNTGNAQLYFASASQIYNPIVFNAAAYADGGKAAIRADASGLQLYGQLTAGASDINMSSQVTSAVTAFGQLTSSGANGLTLKTPGNGSGTFTLTLSNTLNPANNYTGNTTLQNLTILALGAADQISNGAGKGNLIITGGTFRMGGFSETINGLSGNGTVDGLSGTPTLTVGDGNATSAFSGVIKNTAGTLALTKIGTGTLTLSGNNTYSGATQVDAGTLVFANTSAKGAGTATTIAAGSIGLGVGAVSGDYSSANVSDLFNTNTLSGFNLAAGSGVALDTTAGSFNQTTGLTAARALTKLGSNTLTLSGTNTYNGTTTISGGTLKAGSTTALTTTGAFSIAAGATLDLGGFNNTISSLSTTTGTITDSSAPGAGGILKIATALSGVANSQLLTGSLGLQIYGGSTTSTLLSNTANTYSGGTILGNGSGTTFTRWLGSGTVGVGSGGNVTSGIFGTGAITLGAATTDKSQLYFAGATTINNNIVVNSAVGFDGVSDVGAIRVESAGNVIAGAINANLADATFNAQNNPNLTLNVTGAISGNSGVRVTSQVAGGLTVTLTSAANANTYAGNTTVDGNGNAILALGAANQIANGAGKGNLIVNNAKFHMGGFSETINGLSGNGTVDGISGTPTLTVGDGNATSTFSGVIKNTAGALALTKTGNGTLTLSNTNTYSGATLVSTGTLLVNGSTSASSAVNVSSGAILGGNGMVGGSLTVASGATLAPGNSPGILSSGNLSLSGILSMEINGVTVGTLYDQVNVTGTVSLVSGNTLTLSLGYTPTDGTNFFLINNDLSDAIVGTLNGFAQDATFTLASQLWKISYTGDSGTNSFSGSGNDLVIQAIPEPATWALLAFSLTTVMVLRRRRQS